MINKNLLINNNKFIDLLKKTGIEKEHIEKTINLVVLTKEKRKELENLRSKQNKLSKNIGIYKKEKKDTIDLFKKIGQLKTDIQNLNDKLREEENLLNYLLMKIPNVSDLDVPDGKNEEDNIILKEIGTKPIFSFKPKEHFELKDNWLDFERGVKLAKSRFTTLKNDGARLERALINYMLDFNRKRGFSEWNVPVIVNKEMLKGTGQLPKFKDDLFKIENEELYLIPTAEVSLTNLYNNEIINKEELPLLLTAHTPCFRKEVGNGGKDVRGLIRQHQFNKVELVAITTEEESDKVFNDMVKCASDLLTSLGLCHREVLLCQGDLGFSAAKTIDLEVWLPGQNQFREISSISNTRDFQARRAKIRYRDGKENKLVNTLNGSSLAVGRTLLAIMENYQNEDGSVNIPKVLEPYMR